MQGLIIDYAGVLDQDPEDVARWRELIAEVKKQEISVGILSNEEADSPMAEAIREWEFRGDVDAVVLSGEVGVGKPDRRVPGCGRRHRRDHQRLRDDRRRHCQRPRGRRVRHDRHPAHRIRAHRGGDPDPVRS